MTIRFAAAWGGATPVITRALCPSAPLGAVNDNGRAFSPRRVSSARTQPVAPSVNDPRLLAEALRHFAQYGLAAAAKARAEAEAAAAADDSERRDRWIAICRQLDRRMAEACRRKLTRRN